MNYSLNILQVNIYNNLSIVIMSMFVGPFLLESLCSMSVLAHQFIR
jgi:hypothetical protein